MLLVYVTSFSERNSFYYNILCLNLKKHKMSFIFYSIPSMIEKEII